ncbi:MAG: DinB family protein [Candidatus Sulfotelmatobacter sp.]
MSPKSNLRSQIATSNSHASEAAFIADQLRRAFYGAAWHGPAVMELLAGVDATTALAKPIASVHSIWELLLHIEVWDRAAIVRLGGEKCQPTGTDNFPVPPTKANEAAWQKAIANAKRTHDALVKMVAVLSEEPLRSRCPGKRYDLYHLLHGVAQHELYHAGQIAILKKAGPGV